MNKYSLSKIKTQEQHTNWLSNAKQLALKAYIQVTLYVRNWLHWGYICIQIHIYARNNNSWKKTLNLKESMEGYTGAFGGGNLIKIQSQKREKKRNRTVYSPLSCLCFNE